MKQFFIAQIIQRAFHSLMKISDTAKKLAYHIRAFGVKYDERMKSVKTV